MIIKKTIIFHVLSKKRAVNQNKNDNEYTRDKTWVLVNHIFCNLWCKWVKSQLRGFFLLISLLIITYIASTEYIQKTTRTVAIFHQAIIARVANINQRNIVQESHIKTCCLISKNQNGISIHIKIIHIDIINSAFSIQPL